MQKHKNVFKVYHIVIHEEYNRVFSRNRCIGKWTDFKFNVQLKYPDLFHKHKIAARLQENEVSYQINWPELVDEMVKLEIL